MHGVGRLVDRQPTVSPERLVAQLTPPPTFADASFATYRPDPAEPSQSAAHLATMHPSRYLALIDGVTAVCLTGVHAVDDQNVALRLVALTDRLYDAGIAVLASGEKLDSIFSQDMLAGGFRKKYLRATSRLLALSAAVDG